MPLVLCVRLPVRTALLQNPSVAGAFAPAVRLPVRTALLQNPPNHQTSRTKCDYQSERHCSKTDYTLAAAPTWCDYQSERHCSKTCINTIHRIDLCDYQSERHCSKTRVVYSDNCIWCDYQSERHCSKTGQRKDGQGSDVRLPVRTALLQNLARRRILFGGVRLPVRTALLQNSFLLGGASC